MGTMLYAKGVFINRCFDCAEPDVGRHGARRSTRITSRAGADVIETNTFGANRIKLRGFGLGGPVARDQPSRAPASRARRRREQAYVAGAIGPLGRAHRAVGQDGDRRSRSRSFREQAEALIEAASTCSSSKPSAT